LVTTLRYTMELPQDLQAWIVLIARIAIPILVLFVAFGPKIDAWLSSWGPYYSRDEMLSHWKVTKKCVKPDELNGLTLVTAETAPLIFQKPEVPERTSRQKKKSEKVDKAEKAERYEKADKTFEKPTLERRENDSTTEKPNMSVQETLEPVETNDSSKQQMHFESLINFMAFNRQQPQRVFLPVADPPVPRKKGSQVPTITGKDARKANLEAQMVLRGALELEVEKPNPLLSGVAKSLCDQLTSASVEIQSETFALMVKACIKVLDLPACSDFLCRIEAAGQVLDNSLMDHVMELYWDQKRQDTEARTEMEAQELAPMAGFQLPGLPISGYSMDPQAEPFQHGMAWGMNREEPPLNLPAFSVPEEFKAFPDSILSSEAPEFRPEGLSQLNTLSGLSPEAAEFQPGHKFQESHGDQILPKVSPMSTSIGVGPLQ